MLKFLIARDTMHQNQWLAVIEELGGAEALPIPNSFPQEEEHQAYNYVFMSTLRDDALSPPKGRWTQGPSIDKKGEFRAVRMRPEGAELNLGSARPKSGAQAEQINSK